VSSRRRHTISKRDWSSDVCSSDLGNLLFNFGVTLNYLFRLKRLEDIRSQKLPIHIVEKKIPCLDENGKEVKPEAPNGYKFEDLRSEERRVGKHCPVSRAQERVAQD